MESPAELRAICQAGKERDPGWYAIHRRISIYLTWALLQTPVRVNQISALMLLLGIAGAVLSASRSLVMDAAGWGLLYLAFLLDKVDGEMARYRGQQSVSGILLDRIHHRLAEPLLLFAIGYRAFSLSGSLTPILAALAAMLAANTIEENQQLPAFIAHKYARETGRWPLAGDLARRLPLERAAAALRPLKAFRTLITMLPLVALACILERVTGRAVTLYYLAASAIGLWIYLVFQSFHYYFGKLDTEIAALEKPARQLRTILPALLVAAALLGGARSASAVVTMGTYYVDGSSLRCSTSGPGTQGQPYCTISAALAAHAHAGDTIYVKPGVYRETVTVPGSGMDGEPLVIQALGGPVVIDGADDFASTSKWRTYSGDVWLASGVTWSPVQVFADGARLAAYSAPPASLPPGTFRWVSGQGLYVNVGGGSPGLHQALVGHRASAFLLSGKSWVVIDGFTITRTDDRSVSLSSSCGDVTLSHLTETLSGRRGIQVNACSRVTISSCATTDNADHGIALTGGTTGCLIENNESARNALPTAREANGIYLYGAPSNVLLRNRWHHNQDTGEHMQSGSNDNVSINNTSWSNGDHGYDHLLASRNHHVGDVAYGNYKDGFSIEGNSPANTLANCIAVNNGLTTNEFDLWVDSASSSGFVSDDNLLWNSTSQKPIKFIATLYSSVAAYSAASGRDTRTVQADPRFVDASNGNFHLQGGSPAIDNANSSVGNWPPTDAAGNARVDDPATANTGLGPVAFADRGAFEFMTGGMPPVAALLAAPASGTAPLSITLNASASNDPDGSVVSYRFDFGDGVSTGPQSGATASHTYSAGSWTARVTVTDNAGMVATATTGVAVNAPPVAIMNVSPTNGRSPLSVTANASGSFDPDGFIHSYRFDFGDGTIVGPQPGATATHSYGTGNWLASVTVTDVYGASNTLAPPIAITVGPPNQPPTASLSVLPSSGLTPLLVTADASGSRDSDGSIVSYTFDFGDGTSVGPQSGATASHSYAQGTRSAAVTVTDNDGGIGSATATVTAGPPNQAPNGTISAPATDATIFAGQSVVFRSAGTDPDGQLPLRFAWNFGGGASTTLVEDPGPIVFTTVGTYLVTLTVTDSLGLADPTPDARTITVLPADLGVMPDEIHWTLTGQSSVTFDWRGPDNMIRYGLTPAYGASATGATPNPIPTSSAGPFWEARIAGLSENTVYHYAIGGGADHTFRTPPPRGSSGFTVMAEADIGDSHFFSPVTAVQGQIAAEAPAFTLCVGDLTYGSPNGPTAVDQHFNDVMVWSQDAAYMPSWGNHEWDGTSDDFSNYRGRFDLPNPQTSPNAPAPGVGEDWYWFDYGNIRFINYPEPFTGAWDDWYPKAATLMDAAQSDPAIRFIVTFGHRPAYSSGHHAGALKIKGYLDALGASHSKFVLNLNGHSHDYERTTPQSGVVHITCGNGGSSLEEDPSGTCVWLGGCPAPPWSAYRAYHRGSLKLRFTSGGIEGAELCGPAVTTGNNPDDISCSPGSIMDSFTIGSPTPDRAPVVSAPDPIAAEENSVLAASVTAMDPDGDPIQSLSADLSHLPTGNNATFSPAADHLSGTLSWRPTFQDAGSYSVTFSAANDLAGSVTAVITVRNTDRPPVVLGPAAVEGVEDTVLTIAFAASDPDGDPIAGLSAVVTPTPPGGTPALTVSADHTTGTLRWQPGFSDSGGYIVTVKASNALDGVAMSTVHVANRDRAPVVTSPPAASATEGKVFSLAVTAADPDGDGIDALSADLSELPIGHDAAFTTTTDHRSGTLVWTPGFADSGFYHVTFRAANTMSGSAITAINVGSTDRPPVITVVSDATGLEGAPLTLTLVASDPDHNPITSLTADLSDLPAGNHATFVAGSENATGTLSWTPGYAEAGTYTVRWMAANALADTERTVLHVVNVDRAPVVVAPPSLDRPAESTVSFAVTATDYDGDAIASLTANLGGLPAGNGASFTTALDKHSGTFSWLPSVRDTGGYTLTFSATNTLSGTATTTLRITPPAPPPLAVLRVTPQTGNAPLATLADASLSSDPSGTIVSYRFEFGDGTVAGPQTTPSAAHTYAAGGWTAVLTVTNGLGAVSTVMLPVTVAAMEAGPNLVGNPSFETSASGWGAYSGATIQRVTGGFDGGYAMQMMGAATGTTAFGLNDSPNWIVTTGALGTRYRFGAWVRSIVGTGSAKLQLREYLGNTKIGPTVVSPAVSLTPAWQFLTADLVNQAAGSSIDLQVYDAPLVSGETFLTDNLSIRVVAGAPPPLAAERASSAEAARLVFGVTLSPNPARADATLTLTTTRAGPVKVELYDVSGRRLHVLIDEAFSPAGSRRLPIPRDLAADGGSGPGLYFYRVQTAERTARGRFVILR